MMAVILIAPIMAAIVISALLMPLGWEAPFLLALQVLIEALVGIARLDPQLGEPRIGERDVRPRSFGQRCGAVHPGDAADNSDADVPATQMRAGVRVGSHTSTMP